MNLGRAWFGLCLALAVAGCGSDQGAICDKLDECNAIPAGVSKDDCEEVVEKLSTSSQRSDCAECIDGKSCGSLGACDNECSFL